MKKHNIMFKESELKKKNKTQLHDILKENDIDFSPKMLKKELINKYLELKSINLEEEVKEEEVNEDVNEEVEEEVKEDVKEEEVNEEEVKVEVNDEEENEEEEDMYGKIMVDVNRKIDNISENMNSKLEMLMKMMTQMNNTGEKIEDMENIIDVEKDKTLEDKIKMLLEDEKKYVDIINGLYRMGISFNVKILDTNCHKGVLGEYFLSNQFDYEGISVSKDLVDDIGNEKYSVINETYEDVGENKYDMVFNFNYLEYVEDDKVEEIIKNLLKITRDKIIIIIDFETDNLLKKPYMFERTYKYYIDIISKIIKEDENYTIDQYKINEMPTNIIFLRKMLKVESNLLKDIQEEEKNIEL